MAGKGSVKPPVEESPAAPSVEEKAAEAQLVEQQAAEAEPIEQAAAVAVDAFGVGAQVRMVFEDLKFYRMLGQTGKVVGVFGDMELSVVFEKHLAPTDCPKVFFQPVPLKERKADELKNMVRTSRQLKQDFLRDAGVNDVEADCVTLLTGKEQASEEHIDVFSAVASWR